MKPNPGSDAALELGCTCSAHANNNGVRTDGMWWIRDDCPLHGCGPVKMTAAQLERLAQAERMMQV